MTTPQYATALLPLLLTACDGAPTRPDAILPAVHQVLSAANRFEILALQPNPLEPAPAGALGDFHGFAILSRAAVPDPATREQILAQVYRGIHASDGTVAACFNPRHGIRAERAGKVVDLVICYECLVLHVHADGKQDGVTTTQAPGRALTRVFAARGVTVAQ